MESISCTFCHDGGYLDYNVYCDCSIGAFYEGRDELNLQAQLDELDNGYISTDDDWFWEYRQEYEGLKFLIDLPFYYGVKITDDTEYDDNSDSECGNPDW